MSNVNYQGNYSVELVKSSATEERIKNIANSELVGNIVKITNWEIYQSIWGIQHIDSNGKDFAFNYKEMIAILDDNNHILRENYSAEKMRKN